MIRIMCVIFISYQYILKIECANICRHDQIMRRDNQGNYICCQTIICQKGQMYAFCDSDKGHDTCSNCPEGTYHLDTINTAMMNSILNPCIPKPTCDQPEVKLENGECVCDRSRGYYGNDINNCLLADHKCSGPGYELKDNGKCEPCAEDYFKPEAGADNVCRRKTRCFETQEIDNNGTTTKDRSCRAKAVPIAIVEHQNKSTTSEVACQDLGPILGRIRDLEKQIELLQRQDKQFRRLQKEVRAIKQLPFIKTQIDENKNNRKAGKKGRRKGVTKHKKKSKREVKIIYKSEMLLTNVNK